MMQRRSFCARARMMRAGVALLAVILAGCTHSHTVKSFPADLLGKPVTIRTWRGTTAVARATAS